MKTLLLVLLASSFAYTADYQFENMTAVDSNDKYFDLMRNQSEHKIIITNNLRCSFVDTQKECFPFELAMNELFPKIAAQIPGVKIYNIDLTKVSTFDMFGANKGINVIFLRNGLITKILKPKYCNFRDSWCRAQRSWVKDLLQQTFSYIF